MSDDPVLYSVDDHGVARLTLNRPDNRNAMTDEMLSGLLGALERAHDDQSARVVVLASAHAKVFSAGGDLAGFTSEEPLVTKYEDIERFVRIFRLLGEMGKPSLCAAGGHVLAGALGIAMACDLIVASEDATFGTPEINIGAFPFMIMALIYRNVPRKKTNEMLLLGDRLSAQEAKEAFIVNKVVPAADFEVTVQDWTRRLAVKSPLLMRMGKDAMFRQMDMPLMDALDYLRSQLVIAFSTEDIREGVSAFFEKRDPVWKGR
jgi:enoyl-CoA hydratase/carnithine racemase